ncbi:MAG: molybdopterin-dependent oxidoreductase [Chloroflexota bacterium]
MPTITFNGTACSFSPGATVLEAARQNDVRIPTLCHHSALRNVGACRLCMVEIDGMRGTPTACTTPAADGMVVHTDTPALAELRREILSLILSEHPYTCLVCERHERCNEWQVTIRKAAVTTGCENCPKNGQCELQSLVDETGLGTMIYPISYRGLPVEKDDPFFDRDYNLCILCGRCVRVCQEVRQTGTLAFVNRGPHTVVGTAFGQSHLLSNCEFCGSCVDVCPTGALYDKRTKWEGVPEKTVTTTCPYCSVGCQLDLWVKGNKLIGVRPAAGGAANAGMACARGRFGIIEMVHAPDRVRTPLIRKHGRLVEASWDEALEVAAQALRPFAAAASGMPAAFALLASPHLTNEAAAALASFAEAMGTPYVDVPTALPRIPRAAELAECLHTERSASLRSIRDARLIVAIGTNPRLSHPVAALYIRQAQAGGAKLIVLDPRRTGLARRADEWVPVAPGQDIPAIQDLIARSGTPAAPAVILYGSGVTHYPSAPDTIRAIHALAQHWSADVISLPGAANTLGVLKAGLLAVSADCGYEAIVGAVASRQIKALYVTGELPALDQLANLELLIVQDQFLSAQAAELAHVVFPAASFAEIAGTLTNLEGRQQLLAPAIPAVGDARADAWIVSQLAARLPARPSRATPWPFESLPTSLDSPFPFTLLLERNAFAYRSSALTDRVRGMEQYKPDEECISLHPEDAARLGFVEDDLVKVISAHGSATFLVQLSPDLPTGVAFASINPAHGSPLFPGRLPAAKSLPVRLEEAP